MVSIGAANSVDEPRPAGYSPKILVEGRKSETVCRYVTMSLLPSILLLFVVGGALTLQVGANGRLAQAFSHPVPAAMVNFAVGLTTLTVFTLILRQPLPLPWRAPTALPWWAWIGGCLGACFVTTAAALAPRVGAAVIIASAVAGQMVLSLTLEHFGLAGLPQIPLNASRVAGALLVVTGVVLVQRF